MLFCALRLACQQFSCSAKGNELASVRFASFPDAVIDDAIAQGRVFDSAGAFAIEDPTFAPFVQGIDGDKEAVIGLPLRSLHGHRSPARHEAKMDG